jgi:hypothetical protein
MKAGFENPYDDNWLDTCWIPSRFSWFGDCLDSMGFMRFGNVSIGVGAIWFMNQAGAD